MCGIFGIWHQDHKPVDLILVQQATTKLRHRGPDDEGYLLFNTQTGRLVSCGGQDTDGRLNLPRIETYFGEAFDLAFGYRRHPFRPFPGWSSAHVFVGWTLLDHL